VTEHTGDGTTVAFTFSGYNGTDDGGYLVSVGGIDQPPSKYSISSAAGGTITFVDAPVNGELISIRAVVGTGSGGGGNATSLQGVDISATAPTDGQVLTYVAADDEWKAQDSAGGGGDATSLQGVNISTTAPSSGQGLVYDGTEWAPDNIGKATSLQNAPISTTSPDTGYLLRFDGNQWAPFAPVLGRAWNNTATYSLGDIVSFEQNNGAINIYVSVLNANTGNTPGGAAWVQVVQIAPAAPVSDGGLAAAGVTVAGWLQVEIAGGGYYKIPYFQ
jgi:hypothetical protein